jgi:hypothetical protein
MININFPEDKVYSLDIIFDLHAYINAEDKQGLPQVVRLWKDVVMDAINVLTNDDDHIEWNWDSYHYLIKVRMYPPAWPKIIRDIYKVLIAGGPARDYFMGNHFKDR